MPNKTTQILKEFDKKFTYGGVTGIVQLKTSNATEIKTFITEALSQQQQEDYKERDEYFAYCACGDTLERTGLYPKDATYYCFGCDKTYKLFQEDYQEVLDLELMKDEDEGDYGVTSADQFRGLARNELRDKLRTAIAEKRGKV